MVHISTLRTVGGSIMGLKANEKVGISLDAGRMVIAPQSKAKYTLAELLAQCDVNATPSADEKIWQTTTPTGKEIW
jgi:antitoxin ChpS